MSHPRVRGRISLVGCENRLHITVEEQAFFALLVGQKALKGT